MAPSEWPPENDVDPRFSLANERTFLAWHRTALAYLAAGLAIPELVDLRGEIALAGAMVLIGGVLTGLAHLRWMSAERAIRERRAVSETRMPLLMTMSGVVAAAVVLIALLAR